MTKITVSNAKKFAMKFFRSEITPPPFGNFLEIHPFWYRQASLSEWKKSSLRNGVNGIYTFTGGDEGG